MKTYIYSSCPVCEHPNIHVENGALRPHTASLASSIQCPGSGREAVAQRTEPISRNSITHREEIGVESLPEKPKAFTVWTFGNVQFLSCECDGKCYVMDENGNNYGSWMSVEGFRKRQQKGGPDDWSKLGSAVARIIPL